MFRWLKKRLRKWLLEDPNFDSTEIEIKVNGQLEKVTVTGRAGLSLIGTSDHGERLVSIGQAKSREHWKSLWKKFGGQPPTWQDGTPYDFDAAT